MSSYALYELHSQEERKLANDEKPLLVQLNWHLDDREGRFLLRNVDDKTVRIVFISVHYKTSLNIIFIHDFICLGFVSKRYRF